jgi:hypothetical protein
MYNIYLYFTNSASVKDIIEIFSNLSVLVASVVAIFVAYFGYSLWKKQKISEMKSSSALKYMKALLSLREAINEVRNPFISVDEMSISLKESGKEVTPVSPSKDTIRLVYIRRWKRINEEKVKLQNDSYECEIFFGTKFMEVHEDIYNKVNVLFIELKKYLDGLSVSDFEKNQEIIYDYDNHFTQELSQYFHEAKKFFSKYILFDEEIKN